jgi:hypothetical protein
MTNSMRRRGRALAAALVVAGAMAGLGGCASPYGENGLTGGYREKQLDANHWLVQYDGNGYTPREQVWSYWIHRCAEVTRQNGYAYFALLPEGWTPPPAADAAAPAPSGTHQGSAGAPARHPAVWLDDAGPHVVLAHGSSAPTYIYVPGSTTTVTTWHTKRVVAMFSGTVPPETFLVLDARTVMDDLGPYVHGTVKQPMTRDAVFAHALRWVNASGKALPLMTPPPAPAAAASSPAVLDAARAPALLARHGVAA